MQKSKLSLLFILILTFSPYLAKAQSAYGDPIINTNYEISRSKIDREITQGNIFTDFIKVTNLGTSELTIDLAVSEGIVNVIELDSIGGVVPTNNQSEFFFNVIGKEVGNYEGEITLSGSLNDKILVNISVINKSLNPLFFVETEVSKKVFTFKDYLDFKVNINKVIGEDIYNVSFNYSLKDTQGNQTYLLGSEVRDLTGSLQLQKRYDFPDMPQGYYVLDVMSSYNNQTYLSSSEFQVNIPFWSRKLFGFIPFWLLLILLLLSLLGIGGFMFIRKMIERGKKYKMQLDLKTLAKKSDETIYLGKVAETNHPAYLELGALTTHAVVAGATGGGKSISAQVLIEEVLLKNIAVIVFDPTAQWSGMLRKNTDKKMMSYYPKFGLKPTDAKAFPGNVRQIQSERQAIDIKKYMNPGQIQIFTMNKLTPPQIDTFVATVIANIFRSDPKEYPTLRVMLVFDEVHRLLPKFGGSGKGFLQIERACREFRKWGFGVMLVSQVLSDFVGEIKANINTEVQMRTRDESDLNRIKTKYGEEFLQSLIKASVGVGMFVNPRYNKGKPFFVNFRPILHNTRRLTDEVLEQYNKYGEMIDDIEYQIEQLEAEKVDAFDIKMELKLVKDKLMTGNFTVVDIYLEGLKPRLEKQWETLGKKPKKKELELVDASEVEASLKAAEKERKEGDKKEEEKPATDAKSETKEEPKPEEKTENKKEDAPKEKVEKEDKEKVVKPTTPTKVNEKESDKETIKEKDSKVKEEKPKKETVKEKGASKEKTALKKKGSKIKSKAK